jgi:hypothetical protein
MLLVVVMFFADSALKRLEHDEAMKENRRQAQMALVERQLNEFYEPVSMRLSLDDAVEALRHDKWSADMRKKHIGESIEKTVTLPNHVAILDILKSKAGLAAPDPALRNAINLYFAHASVYQAERDLNLAEDPAYAGFPFPTEFPKEIRSNTERLRAEYVQLRSAN